MNFVKSHHTIVIMAINDIDVLRFFHVVNSFTNGGAGDAATPLARTRFHFLELLRSSCR